MFQLGTAAILRELHDIEDILLNEEQALLFGLGVQVLKEVEDILQDAEEQKHDVDALLLLIFVRKQHINDCVVPLRVGLLDDAPVVHSRHQHQDLEDVVHQAEDYVVLALRDFGHVLVELVLVPVPPDHIVLIDESQHITDDLGAQPVVVRQVHVVMHFQLLSKHLHLALTNYEEQLIAYNFHNVVGIFRFH